MRSRRLLIASGVLLASGLVALLYAVLLVRGVLGAAPDPRIPVAKVRTREARPAPPPAAGGAKREILFGDLHVHTTYSMDAFLQSVPLLYGDGAHPPADACDFARFCSALDFFSINDHAVGLTPARWRETIETMRQCDEIAANAREPDLLPFVGWEWTQRGLVPEEHYGHKNVIFRDLAPARLPTRPIAATGRNLDAMRERAGLAVGAIAATLLDFGHRQQYAEMARMVRAVRATPLCPADTPVRELPSECIETAPTPRELFAKLDDWGFESLVIPHGMAWGNTNPPGASWAPQRTPGMHDPKRQRLLELYSGHGNSEEYRSWRGLDFSGGPDEPRCAPLQPGGRYVPACWQAGQIVRARCAAAGESTAECESRAAEAMGNYAAARDVGSLTVPGANAAEWGNAGQCSDCFQPAFDYRPGASAQAALASGGAGQRLRFGFIASSDNHSARAGSGYKEFALRGMSDAWDPRSRSRLAWISGSSGAAEPRSRALDWREARIGPASDLERLGSFYYSGGLVAAHSEGRSRGALWRAFERREVYGTSGPRIGLWFDLVNARGEEVGLRRVPMGGEARMRRAPHFEVRAQGARIQKPGCPQSVHAALGAERLASLCLGDCYFPGDARHRIDRIEVVRIRPQRHPDEALAALIDDPWRVLPCEDDGSGCRAEFSDQAFVASGRDVLYYVRAVQVPTPHMNGANLRCEPLVGGGDGDMAGCASVEPCTPGLGDDPDCLAELGARAWSSPIFVDYAQEKPITHTPQERRDARAAGVLQP